MSRLPAIHLYVDDYEAATAHLTLEEDGAYMRLLRLCWRSPGCTIPADDAWIKRMLRVDDEAYDRAVRPVLAEFFTKRRSRLFQKRLLQEFVIADEKKQARSEAGKTAAAAKRRKTKAKASSNRATDEPSTVVQTTTSHSHSHSHSQQQQAAASDAPAEEAKSPERPDDQDRASTLLPRILEAAGIDVATDPRAVTGHWFSSGPRHEVRRWLALDLTDEEILAAVAEAAARLSQPPRSLRYFAGALQDAAGRKAAPPLAPSKPPAPRQSGQSRDQVSDIRSAMAAAEELERRRAARGQ